MWTLHISAYLSYDLELIGSMRILESLLELLFLFEYPKWYTSRDTTLGVRLEYIGCDRFYLFIRLREYSFPLLPCEIRESRIIPTYILRDTSELSHGDIYFISRLILDFHIFAFYESYTFFQYLDIASDTMLTVYDEVSWCDLEEEIEVLDRRFAYPILYEYLPEDIICHECESITLRICLPSLSEEICVSSEREALFYMPIFDHWDGSRRIHPEELLEALLIASDTHETAIRMSLCIREKCRKRIDIHPSDIELRRSFACERGVFSGSVYIRMKVFSISEEFTSDKYDRSVLYCFEHLSREIAISRRLI